MTETKENLHVGMSICIRSEPKWTELHKRRDGLQCVSNQNDVRAQKLLALPQDFRSTP